jgi:hypothetical protein
MLFEKMEFSRRMKRKDGDKWAGIISGIKVDKGNN